MIDVPDEKTITGLTRTELIAMVYSLKKERDTAIKVLRDRAEDARKRYAEMPKSLRDEGYLSEEALAKIYDATAGEIELRLK